MEMLCPLCNGLETIELTCTTCRVKMEDGGAISGYMDPYAPYMEITNDRYCVHLLYCPVCYYDFHSIWKLIER